MLTHVVSQHENLEEAFWVIIIWYNLVLER